MMSGSRTPVCSCSLFVAALAATHLACVESHLDLFNVKGSPYNKGLQLGKSTRGFIEQNMRLDPSLPQLLNWSRSSDGAPVWKRIWGRQAELYPDYVQEVQGMADGAEVPLLEVALTNMEVDLLVMLPWVNQSSKPGGPRTTRCSDVSGPGAMGHNEDNDDAFVGLCFLVADEGHYVSFNYPAQLAGNAFGWSARGVVVSINQLAPTAYLEAGAGFYFLARDALEAESVDDAVARLTRYPAFSGFSANVGSAVSGPINLEVAGAAHAVTQAPFSHFNEYEHLPTVHQLPDVSSQARQARWEQLGRPSQPLGSILAFLSDQHNTSYPVYRQDDATGESTLATMGADLVNRTVRVFTGKPDASEPAYTFALP